MPPAWRRGQTCPPGTPAPREPGGEPVSRVRLAARCRGALGADSKQVSPTKLTKHQRRAPQGQECCTRKAPRALEDVSTDTACKCCRWGQNRLWQAGVWCAGSVTPRSGATLSNTHGTDAASLCRCCGPCTDGLAQHTARPPRRPLCLSPPRRVQQGTRLPRSPRGARDDRARHTLRAAGCPLPGGAARAPPCRPRRPPARARLPSPAGPCLPASLPTPRPLPGCPQPQAAAPACRQGGTRPRPPGHSRGTCPACPSMLQTLHTSAPVAGYSELAQAGPPAAAQSHPQRPHVHPNAAPGRSTRRPCPARGLFAPRAPLARPHLARLRAQAPCKAPWWRRAQRSAPAPRALTPRPGAGWAPPRPRARPRCRPPRRRWPCRAPAPRAPPRPPPARRRRSCSCPRQTRRRPGLPRARTRALAAAPHAALLAAPFRHTARTRVQATARAAKGAARQGAPRRSVTGPRQRHRQAPRRARPSAAHRRRVRPLRRPAAARPRHPGRRPGSAP